MRLPKISNESMLSVYLVSITNSLDRSTVEAKILDINDYVVGVCEVSETVEDAKLNITCMDLTSLVAGDYKIDIRFTNGDYLDSIFIEIVNGYVDYIEYINMQYPVESNRNTFNGHIELATTYNLTINSSITLESREFIDDADSSTTFTHKQIVPNSRWVINHMTNSYPSVSVIDSSGELVYGNVVYIDRNTVTVEFSFPFAGRAFLNY